MCPHFVGWRIFVPQLIGIGEIPSGEDQVVGSCGNLFGGVGNSSIIGKIDGHFDLVNDHFERLIEIVRGGHVGSILLQGGGDNILVVTFEVIDHLEATQLPVRHIFCLERSRVNFFYARKDLEFQCLFRIVMQTKDGVLLVQKLYKIETCQFTVVFRGYSGAATGFEVEAKAVVEMVSYTAGVTVNASQPRPHPLGLSGCKLKSH